MKDNADMRRNLRNLYARSNLIFRKFHHCSALILSKLTSTVCYNSFSLIFILFYLACIPIVAYVASVVTMKGLPVSGLC